MKVFKIAALALIVTIVASTTYIMMKQNKERTLSDVITYPAIELGQGAHLLLPNLINARVVAPDRPHDPSELMNDGYEKITRKRIFSVNTDENGFRKTNPYPLPAKILCVGDSVTFGWGVSEQESYPHLLGKKLELSIHNAGVPAMKPRHVAQWMRNNLTDHTYELVLFARRIDWGNPDPWNRYFDAIAAAKKAAKPAKFGLILPPISTFDPRGLKHQEEELSRLKTRFPDTPIIDLTNAFRESAPNTGVVLELNETQQMLVDKASGEAIVTADSPPLLPGHPALAPEITNYFEDNPSVSEPLFFDGGHPTAEGFEVFANAVHFWLEQERLLTNDQ